MQIDVLDLISWMLYEYRDFNGLAFLHDPSLFMECSRFIMDNKNIPTHIARCERRGNSIHLATKYSSFRIFNRAREEDLRGLRADVILVETKVYYSYIRSFIERTLAGRRNALSFNSCIISLHEGEYIWREKSRAELDREVADMKKPLYPYDYEYSTVFPSTMMKMITV